jgi:F-type H+-transporting ATPase subunit epsilon
MARLFKLEVHTPYRRFFDGEIVAFQAVLPDGLIGVMADRIPFTAPLEISALRIQTADGAWKEAAVTSGIVEVTRRGAVILAGTAEWPDEIDKARAEAAAKRAEERMNEPMMAFEAARARASFARASNRLAVRARWEAAGGKTAAAAPETAIAR